LVRNEPVAGLAKLIARAAGRQNGDLSTARHPEVETA
jgi:hypothetical protein